MDWKARIARNAAVIAAGPLEQEAPGPKGASCMAYTVHKQLFGGTYGASLAGLEPGRLGTRSLETLKGRS